MVIEKKEWEGKKIWKRDVESVWFDFKLVNDDEIECWNENEI